MRTPGRAALPSAADSVRSADPDPLAPPAEEDMCRQDHTTRLAGPVARLAVRDRTEGAKGAAAA